MKFAKIVFRAAGVWGVLILTPLYFLFDFIGVQDPPALTHPQFYFGFVSVAMVWQFAFWVIGSDPVRFRSVMIPAVLEKLSYVLTLSVLAAQRRLAPVHLLTAVPDTLLSILFIIAFVKTGPRAAQA